MRIGLIYLLLLAFVSCGDKSRVSSTAHVPDEPYDTVAFERKATQIHSFFSNLAEKQNFHGAVLISFNQRVLYKGAFGYQDPGRKKKKLQVRSVFQLASVSKQFTAAAILKLMEEGKLNLDDSNMGVVNLMIQHQPEIYFYPDRKMDYSNTGYVILAAIVEQVSGMSFKDYMEEEIFKPNGMKHTHVLDINHVGDFSYVDGWDRWGARVRHDYLDGATGDKGIYSTVEDMYRWDQVLHGQQFLSDSTLKMMYEPGSKKLEGPFNYAFGWRTYTLKTGETIVYHGGWWNGFKSFFMRDLENKHSIIILCNNERSNFRNLDPLVDILYERKNTEREPFSAYLHHSPGRK
jgi:CubicO group peptidase (beta-lactamase class C family)